MKSNRKSSTDAAIASSGRRSTITQRACVAWKIISRMTDAKAMPAQ